MLVYEHAGIKSVYNCSTEAMQHSPSDLAAADIVLTTYDTLQRDLYSHNVEETKYSLRRPKKYQVALNCKTEVVLQPLKAWLTHTGTSACIGHVERGNCRYVHASSAQLAVLSSPCCNGLSSPGHILDYPYPDQGENWKYLISGAL